MATLTRDYDRGNRNSLLPRPSAASTTPVNHSRRSWADNGVHYRVESASYVSPGISFGSMSAGVSGVANGLSPPTQHAPHRRSRSLGIGENGLLGTAFNLLNNLASPQHENSPPQGIKVRKTGRRVQIEGDMYDEYEDDSAAGPTNGDSGDSTGGRPRSMMARFKTKISEAKQRPQNSPNSHDRSSAPRPRPVSEQYPQRGRENGTSQTRNSSAPMMNNLADQKRERERSRPQRTSQSGPADLENTSTIEALHIVASFHADGVKKCKRQLERASRQLTTHSGHLQPLLNELRAHERSHAEAVDNLQVARDSTSRPRSQRPASNYSKPSQRRSYGAQMMDDLEDPLPHTGFGIFDDHLGARPFFADFDDEFHQFAAGRGMFSGLPGQFDGLDGSHAFENDLHNVSTMPGATFDGAQKKRPRPTSTPAGKGPQPRSNAAFAASTPTAPQPPPTLLTAEEAQRLFQLYIDCWQTLPRTDPNIPYPTRDLQASTLLSCDTIWAPNVSTHSSTWSRETIMQSNAQAFFLRVVGLFPKYTEVAGRVSTGYDRSRATPTQASQLVDILKKEKIRWHSDRLGRRSGGTTGPNEVLQQDERARAVFHAVCELMECVQ